MITYLIRRFSQMIVALFLVSVLVFVIIKLAPGDPARIMAGVSATPETIENIRHEFGLDQPFHIQYYVLMKKMLTGELRSLTYRAPIKDLVGERIQASLELALAAIVLVLLTSIPFGIIAAVKRNTVLDYGVTTMSLIGISIPVFWFATILMIVFGAWLRVLPISGRGATLHGWAFLTVDGLRHMIIPAVSLASVQIALNARLTRSSMLEVLSADYLRTARAKGIAERFVILRHAFRNALIPVLTNVGIQIGGFLGGAILTETVTAWPGVGRLMYEAITRRDEPLIIVLTLLAAAASILSYVIVDVLYAFIDPRIAYD
jgi:peptide/nickel transport system permease protein